MVHLIPNPGPGEPAVALGNQPVDSGALTEDSISKPEIPDLGATPPGTAGGFAERPPVFTPDPSAEVGTDQESEDGGGTDRAAAPHPAWHSQKNAKSRKIAMMISVALASVVSASILFSVLFRNRSDHVAKQDAGGSTSGIGDDVVAKVDQPDSESTGPSAVDLENGESSADPLAAQDHPLDSASESTVDVGPAIPTDSHAKQPPSENLVPPADLFPENPLLPSNPLEGLSPSDGNPMDKGNDALPDAATLKELPKEFQGLLLGLEGFDRPQFNNAAPAPKTIDQLQLDRAAKSDVDIEVAIDQPDPINMVQSLGLPTAMQAADPEGYPLNDLMLVMSQLSGVPIEIQWVSYEIVGLPIEQRVSLPNPKDWPTLEQALSQVCQASESTFDKNVQSITVRPTDERFNQAVQSLLDLSDLPTESASAVTLARLLLGQTDGDPNVVAVPKELGPTQLAALVCDAIRRIRGVPGKLSDESFSRWGGTFQKQLTAWPELESGVSGATRIQPATFVSLVRQISKMNGATCYINWDDSAKKDFKPNEKLMPKTGEGVSAADALRQILQPANLHVRVVDPRHWWIGSEASFDRFPVVVWFPETKNADNVAKQVQSILQGASMDENITGTVAVDSATQTCVAILPRYLLRQLPRLLGESP
ncbi:MAG: hypothetical protein KDB00_28985 [Planctomycetales bacterium]|nr:hypothetical protein [Planctomycetales bacterium]